MFNSARLKLTAWYLLILIVVMGFFSLTIHTMLIRQVTSFVTNQRNSIEKRFGPIQSNVKWEEEIIEEANHRIIVTLAMINGIIIVVAGALSFVLAGKTLYPLKLILEEQNRFVSDSSHELRTPLTSLKLAMEVALRNKKLTIKEARELLSENIAEVDRLKILSDKLLFLASGGRTSALENYRKISLNQTLEASVKKVSMLAKAKKIKIENQIKQPIDLLGDDEKLQELFGIILENAIKYSTGGNSVQVSSMTKNKCAVVSIKDKGMGIDSKDLPRIFDRFFRGDLARSKDIQNGFGLGLSIAKKIAKDHRGSITVKSARNKGTTFTIYLPV